MNFNFFGRKQKAPKWSDLSRDQQTQVARKIMAMGGPRYKVVSGFDESQRERGFTEQYGEDHYLDSHRRGRLLDLTRNAVRNSATFNTILKQLDYNVVGTKGGKVIIDWEDQQLTDYVKSRFAAWTRSADFFDGLTLNQTLKLVMHEMVCGGDCVILFDDGLVEDSGKLLIYESDEIGSVDQATLERKYGKRARQSLGKVYNANDRWIGTVVSRACRGKEIFDADKCYFLRRDPDVDIYHSMWIQPSNVWRAAQGRGVSPAAASIATITDLEDLCGYELQAAKKNAQTFAQIIHTGKSQDVELPATFDSAEIEGMTDEEIQAAAQAEWTMGQQTISFQRARSCGIVYEQLPDDYKMELLNTNHPNERIQEFVEWLAGRSSAVFGLSQAFATLMPTGADFRAQQLMTAPAFVEGQKWLEQICDWIFVRFIRRLVRLGELDPERLPGNWLSGISWSWPSIDELDEVAHANAIGLQLRNMTKTYKDVLGNEWKNKLIQTAYERKWMLENGITPPADLMISGGQTQSSKIEENI